MSTYGIDLGTTYSCIARLDRNGNPEIIRNQADASETLASAVFFESADNVVIGNSAKDMVETDGDRVVQFVKRYIGKDDAPTYSFDGKSYTPVEISALILGRLKQMVEEQGDTVTDVVITCPAYFGIAERNATRKAGELAGMNVLNLINEPTAAALSYCARQFQEERTILVYDLGGGTFDVTIVRMSMVTDANGNDVQKVIVVATGGNDRLGGKDWDDKLFDHIFQICCDENGLSPDEIDAETRQQIRGRVEAAKKKLSNTESTKVKINVNGTMTTITVTREEFESLTADLVTQTMNYLETTMEKAGNPNIDTVLMVGGSSFMPMIRAAVEGRFPGKVQLEDPDRAVAKGAAVYASLLVDENTSGGSEGGSRPDPKPGPGGDDGESTVGRGRTIDVVDGCPRSFGPGILDESNNYVIDNIIKEGAEMPALAVKTYYTVVDNQKRIVLRVFENVSKQDSVTPCLNRDGEEQTCEPADMVRYLGELEMNLPPYTPKGSPLEVTFQVEMSGIYVKTVNLSTGDVVETTIRFATPDADVDGSNTTGITISGE